MLESNQVLHNPQRYTTLISAISSGVWPLARVHNSVITRVIVLRLGPLQTKLEQILPARYQKGLLDLLPVYSEVCLNDFYFLPFFGAFYNLVGDFRFFFSLLPSTTPVLSPIQVYIQSFCLCFWFHGFRCSFHHVCFDFFSR